MQARPCAGSLALRRSRLYCLRMPVSLIVWQSEYRLSSASLPTTAKVRLPRVDSFCSRNSVSCFHSHRFLANIASEYAARFQKVDLSRRFWEKARVSTPFLGVALLFLLLLRCSSCVCPKSCETKSIRGVTAQYVVAAPKFKAVCFE